MSQAQDARAPRVFLSYSSDDAPWVNAFKKDLWFGNQLGPVHIADYKDGENLAFGPLGRWIDHQVDTASVMIAFVSTSYIASKYSAIEWKNGLKDHHLKRLLFVPVMLDADAQTWWRKQKTEGRLQELSRDYQFADFVRGGRRVDIDPDKTEVIGQITRLAHVIRDALREPSRVPPPKHSSSRVVLLGHPTSRMPDDVTAHAKELGQSLRLCGLPVDEWADGWDDNPPEAGPAVEMFIRPLIEQEAASHAMNTGQTGEQLRSAGRDDAPVTLWLAPPRNDKRFAQAAATCHSGKPALRTDTPTALAAWLRDLLRVEDVSEDLVLQIEDLGGSDEAVPDPQARKLADTLQSMISAVVNTEVIPSPTQWTFFGSMFRKQVKILPARAIVVLHDLNINPTSGRAAACKAIERKFQEVQDELLAAATSRADGQKLDLFKMALVVNNTDALPFSTYPSTGRWKDWRLLSFEPAGPSERPGEAPPLRPDPASLAVFRGHLRAWATKH